MASTETSPLMTLMSLPDDVLQRLLAGVPLDDHRAAASVCRAFRDVIDGPNFLALRRRYGFAERGIVLVETCPSQDGPDQRLEIRTAHKKSGVITITDISNISRRTSISRDNSTTDGCPGFAAESTQADSRILSPSPSSSARSVRNTNKII